ncbi:MAG: hypothetical protein HOV79_16810 [Hamadaea sp.]|nr:hypothetical protein [Hamadaea sp.]
MSDSGLEHLAQLDDGGRRQWLERRLRDGGANEVLNLYLRLDERRDQSGEDARVWVDLRLWLLRTAPELDVLSAREYAIDLAYYVLATRDKVPEAATGLPSSDEVVSLLLTALPVSVDDVAVIDDVAELRQLSLDRMRSSRFAKNIVRAAEYHLPHLEDADLVERLKEWLVIAPRLV